MKGLKHLGYITKSGPGVEISTTVKERSYTFNCKVPDALLRSLSTYRVEIAGNVDEAELSGS
jgi:hypothetical protein